jgi:signal transduction histidine kinase
MRLNFARLLLDRDSPRARVELEKLEDLAHRTVREIRSMLFALRPVVLETEGLLAALNQYVDNLRESDGLPIQIEAEQYEDCLDLETQGVVFAIVEEAVNNARKHADASRILIRLAVQEDLFVAQVMDDGRGFDMEAVLANYGSRGSLGLINLRERAELVEGNVAIDSEPNRGTCVTLVVPIVEEPV